MAKNKGPFLAFKIIKDTGKTLVLEVCSASNGGPLGEIRWYPAWRRYVFAPNGRTLFDSTCMKEITDKIDDLMEKRKRDKTA